MPIIAGYQPAQNTLQQYVPLPFKEMMMAGQAVQNRADEFNATTDAFSDGLLKAKVLEGDKGILQQKSKEFQAIVDEANKGNIADPVAYQKIKSKIKSIANDSEFIQAQEHYLYNKEAMKNYSDIVKAGDYGDEVTWDYMQSLKNYNANGGLRGGNNLGDNMFTKGVDINEDIKKYYSDIPESGHESLGKLGQYYYENGWKGISEGTIKGAAYNAFETYWGSAGGNQLKKRYDMQVAQGALDPKLMGKQEWVFNQFLAPGMRRVHSVTDSDYSTVFNHWMDREEDRIAKQSEERIIMETPYESLNKSIIGGLLDKYTTASTYPFDPIGSQTWNAQTHASNKPTKPPITKVEVETKFYNNLTADEKKTIDTLKKSTGSLDGALKYLSSIKDRKISSSYEAFNAALADKKRHLMVSNLASFKFYNMTTGQMETANDVRKKFDPAKTGQFIVRGQYLPDNPINDIQPDQGDRDSFIQPYLVVINGWQYVVSQPFQEKTGSNYATNNRVNKISQASRMGLPVDYGNGASITYKEGQGFTYTNGATVITAPNAVELSNTIKDL